MSRPISPIPLTSPKMVYESHKIEIDEAIGRVLESGWYILGQEVDKFEEEFAGYIGTNYAIGVANGTDALILALRACGVGVNDLVFTVSHTAVATVAAIELVGATPVLIDIDPTYYTMDPGHLEHVIKAHLNGPGQSRPKAIIPVHLYGQPADMPAIMDIAKRYQLHIVEDCAQAHGAALSGEKVGTWGDLATFSFYPTKNLGAIGDGGAIITNNQQLAEKIYLLRQYGWKGRYISEIPGANSRLDELQAAILRVNLKYLHQQNTQRQELAEIYNRSLSETNLILPERRPDTLHVYHQYVVRTSKRDSLRSFLGDRQIGTGIHYPVPVHLQPAYLGRLGIDGSFPHTEKIASEILSLPMFPCLEQEQVKQVVKAICEWESTY